MASSPRTSKHGHATDATNQYPAKKLHQEELADDHSKVLVICKNKNAVTPNSLIFWLKLQGHEVFVATTYQMAHEFLNAETFSSAFIDIAQLESFPQKLFPTRHTRNILLLGFSSKAEDETVTLPFIDEKAIAKDHGIHYYFPDPMEVNDLLEWILTEKKLYKFDVEKLCGRLDEDIRLNKFHDREKIVPVESRHVHEISVGYAEKLMDKSHHQDDITPTALPRQELRSNASSSRSIKFENEDKAVDNSNILVVCKDKSHTTPRSLIFWLKLRGHHVLVADSLERVQELLDSNSFSSAFVDVGQIESFQVKLFPSKNNRDTLLLGFSSKAEDEATTLPFKDEKEIAKAHNIHYYFPDPMEVNDLLEWILTERKLHKYSIEKLCSQLDEDIRMNKFHDREKVIPVEARHHYELSTEYAYKLDQNISQRLDRSTSLNDSHATKFQEEAMAEDPSNVLLLCKDKNAPTVTALLFWLKLQGHHVLISTTYEEIAGLLKRERFSSAFLDIYQLESFHEKLSLGNTENILLLGYSSKAEDETKTLPFPEEKIIAKNHGIHYYFPDPMEVKDLLEWILAERKLHKYDIEKLCSRVDEDIRMNKFHDREKVIPVERRHYRELSGNYAHKLEEEKDVAPALTETAEANENNFGMSLIQTIYSFFSGTSSAKIKS